MPETGEIIWVDERAKCTTATCRQLFFNKPSWDKGFSSAVMGMIRDREPVWQRVCMTADCGFAIAGQQLGTRNVGAAVRMRFGTESNILR